MKKYFITGLLIWVPLVITIWVLLLVVDTLDQTLLLLPLDWRPEHWLGVHVRGMGVVLTVVIVFVTGVLAANFIGQRLVRIWNGLLHRIPFFSSVYSSVKQVSDTLFSSQGEAFRKALLVQWPRPGMWTIAFLTGVPGGDVATHLQGDFVSIYVPTTPNPTGGYFVMLPRADVIELDMSVDDAFKIVISMGVVVPDGNESERREAEQAARPAQKG
ncbi:MAG: DUF502 domain-containing protein [Betaproteobacteria bacterium]|nr:DUF502 domain-containing protein [Betaproteobacteria bacterium]